ncbi:hypothetical protein ACFXJ5_06890 [Streptomyces sp. NPDC059373]
MRSDSSPGEDARVRFACECFAWGELPGGGSAYVRPMHWISRITALDVDTAAAWVMDRLDLLAMLLDEPSIHRAPRQMDGPDARWWVAATLRAGRSLELDITDSEQVRYQVVVIPVRRRCRTPPRARSPAVATAAA